MTILCFQNTNGNTNDKIQFYNMKKIELLMNTRLVVSKQANTQEHAMLSK